MLYITADTHYNHYNLVRRGKRPEGFEHTITQNWTTKVTEHDTVIHLGDVCFAKQSQAHEMFIAHMPGRKILVRGNHDGQSDAWYLSHGWNEVHKEYRVNYHGLRILFTHIPVADDGSFDVNIHGHFHDDEHRRDEPEMVAIRSPKQKLVALELMGYDLFPVTQLVGEEYQAAVGEPLNLVTMTVGCTISLDGPDTYTISTPDGNDEDRYDEMVRVEMSKADADEWLREQEKADEFYRSLARLFESNRKK